MIGGVNGIITGLVAITPAAGYVNGWGAIAIGVIASTLVYFAINFLSRLRPFRNVDDTLGVIYTHGFAGLMGGLLVGVFADPNMAVWYTTSQDGLIAPAIAGPDPRQPDAAQVAGARGGLGDRVVGGRHVHAAEAGGLVRTPSDVRRGPGDRRPRRPRPRGLPSDVPSLGYPNGVPGLAARRPVNRANDGMSRSGVRRQSRARVAGARNGRGPANVIQATGTRPSDRLPAVGFAPRPEPVGHNQSVIGGEQPCQCKESAADRDRGGRKLPRKR